MGKLKDNIKGLTVLLAAIDKRADAVTDDLVKISTNVQKYFEICAEGYDSLLEYFDQRVKKAGKTGETIFQEDWATLSVDDFMDSNVSSFVKTIETNRTLGTKATLEWTALCNKEAKGVMGDLKKAEDTVETIRGMLAKKKAKLIQNADYKAKYKLYEDEINKLAKSIELKENELATNVIENGPQGVGIFEKMTISGSTLVGEVEKRASMACKKALKELDSGNTKLENGVKKFRGMDFNKAIANFKKWMNDADAMEAAVNTK